MATSNDGGVRRRSEKIGDYVAIYQRGNVWWMNYQDPAGKQVRSSLKTRSKKQAKLLALKKEGELQRGVDSARVVVATVEEAIAAYDAYLVAEGRAPKTLLKYGLTLKRVQSLAAQRRVKDMRGINLSFIDAFRQQRTRDGTAPKTLHTETTVVRQLVNFALSRDLLADDPLKGLKLKRPKAPPQPCWTFDQVERILDALRDDPYFVLYGVLARTGLRIAEAKYLDWEDVDFTNGVLRIRGKVVDAATGEAWRPKSGDQRIVPISAPVRALLEAQPRPARWVFTSPSSLRRPAGQPIDDRRVLAHLKQALKKLGLPGHTHTFRHSLISHALLSGTPEAVVRKWAGHVDAEILKLYTHIADRDSKRHMDRLFGGGEDEARLPAADAAHRPTESSGSDPSADGRTDGIDFSTNPVQPPENEQ